MEEASGNCNLADLEGSVDTKARLELNAKEMEGRIEELLGAPACTVPGQPEEAFAVALEKKEHRQEGLEELAGIHKHLEMEERIERLVIEQSLAE